MTHLSVEQTAVLMKHFDANKNNYPARLYVLPRKELKNLLW